MAARALAVTRKLDQEGFGVAPLGGDDLDRLPIAQRRAQWHQAAVDFGGDTAIADVGVDRVREIHRRGAGGQAQNLSFRREHVHLVREEIDFDALEEFLGTSTLLDLHQTRQPFAGAVVLDAAEGVAAGFVLPVRRDAGFGYTVHLLGTNLHFDGDAVRAEQGRVQGLVPVDARDRDVVLEPSRHGLVDAVHQAERAITRIRAVDDDAKTVDIDHFIQRDVLALHFLVNAIEMLLAAVDVADELGFFQRPLEGLGDLGDKFFLIAAGPLQLPLENLVAVGVQRPEPQVLQFELDRVQAETLGDRRVDSRVSRAVRRRFTGGMAPRVRMLCMRSASLTMMTRMSRTMATAFYGSSRPAPPDDS